MLCNGRAKAGQAERQDDRYSESAESAHRIAIHVPSPHLACGDSGAGCSRPPEPSPCSHSQTASVNERSLMRQPPVKTDSFYIAGEPSGELKIRAVGAGLTWHPLGAVIQIGTAIVVRAGRVDLQPLGRFLQPGRKLRWRTALDLPYCLTSAQGAERLGLHSFLKLG